MEPTHIFYKDLPIDENNIFTANISKKKTRYKIYYLENPVNMQLLGSPLAKTQTT